MQRFIKTLNTPTARSSALYYFGNFAVGGGRYLFHLLLLRLLLPSEYGEFLAYLSLLYLLGIPSTTVNNVVVKFVAEYRGKKDHRSINELFYYLIEKLTPYSLLLGLPLIFFSNILSTIFKAHSLAFVILGLSLFISIISTVIRSYVLAFQRFTAQILIGFAEVSFTLFLAFVFIRLGMSATGAVLAQIIAGIIAVIITFILIRHEVLPPLFHTKKHFPLSTFTGYSLIYAIGSMSLISTDVLTTRFFFSEHLSGIYSSLSVLGRTIYFGLGPLIALVLPIASHRQSATGSSRSVFVKLGGTVFGLGLAATTVFSLFPKLIVSVISGANYLEAVPYLPIFAVSMLLFSLNLFTISYFMAIGRAKVNTFLLLATIAQPVLITLFHTSLNQVIWVNLSLESALFLLLLWQIKQQRI